jgi:hypothetical protein
MALTSAFLFTNVTGQSTDITPVSLGLTTNYAISSETANQSDLSNKTAPVDAEELITYRSRPIPSVNTSLDIRNPAPVKSGVQYQVVLEETLVTTDSSDASYRVDEPIVMQLLVRHPKSGNITSAKIAEVFTRLAGSLRKVDGTWRFEDLMRGAERPIAE